MRKILSIVISTSIFASQASYAGGAAEALAQGQVFAEVYGAKAIRYGFNKEGGYTMSLLDDGKNVIKSLVFPKATAKEIADATPSKITKLSKKEIAIRATLHLKQFPLEASKFFIALGAIATKDLVFKFEKDPTAYETFINGQLSVPGQVGFAAFMFFNNATTTAAMQSALANNKLARFAIPYFGMSAGLTASKIVSEIMTYPGYSQMAKCVAKLGTEEENNKVCDEAYSTWMDYHYERKISQLAPSIISMIASSGILAATWYAGEKAAGTVSIQTAKVIAARGFEFALSLNQAGLILRGIQVVSYGMQVANLVGFVELNSYIEEPVLKFWNNNVAIGPSLNEQRRSLLFDAISGQIDEKTKEKMTEFAKTMEAWQQNNAQETLTAHNNWINYLSHLGATYDVSKSFYSDLVNDVWNLKFGPPGLRKEIFRTYPLYGVKLVNGQTAKGSDYLALADDREEKQKAMIAHYVQYMEQSIQTHQEWFKNLDWQEQNIINEMISNFKSGDTKKISRSLLVMGSIVNPEGLLSGGSYSKPFAKYMKETYEYLGKPVPQLYPGYGYLRAREDSYADQGLKLPESIGSNSQSRLAVIVEKMISGDRADAGPAQVIKTINGFKAEFNFPRIVEGKQNGLYNTVRGLEYLLDNGIKQNVLGDASTKGSNIGKWWEFHIEPQYINAWVDFGDKYEKIVEHFLVDLKKDKRPVNYVEVSQGLLSSTEQEIYVYLQILKAIGTQEQKARTVKFDWALGGALTEIKNMVENIKPKLEQKRLAYEKFQLDSRLSNNRAKQISERLKALEKEIQGLAAETKMNKLLTEDISNRFKNSTELFVAKEALNKILVAFEKMITHVQIVNAVNYQETHESGNYQSSKCIEMKNNGKTLSNPELLKACAKQEPK